MSNTDEEVRAARVMVWINNVFGGGIPPRSSRDPDDLVSEELAPSALQSFSAVSLSVASGTFGVAQEFEGINEFESSAARSAKITLVNKSPFFLVKFKQCLEHSNWMAGEQPPESIAPGQTVVWGSESNGLMVGTEGSVEYLICGEYKDSGPQDLKMSFKVDWNNPFAGANSCRHSWPKGDASNPIWNKVSLKDPDPDSISGDHCKMRWIFQYEG